MGTPASEYMDVPRAKANADIGAWDTSGVTRCFMFCLPRPLTRTSARGFPAATMRQMFSDASAFDQDLGW